MQLQIRLGLKAELGALYPLLLLRPLEATILDPVLLTVTLTGIKRIAMEPQMQVDPILSWPRCTSSVVCRWISLLTMTVT